MLLHFLSLKLKYIFTFVCIDIILHFMFALKSKSVFLLFKKRNFSNTYYFVKCSKLLFIENSFYYPEQQVFFDALKISEICYQ